MPTITPARISHINVVVRDLDRTLSFYCGLLGGHVVHGPYEAEGPELQGIALGVQMYGVAATEAAVRGATVTWGDDDNAPVFEILEFVRPRPIGHANNTLHNIGLNRVALYVDDPQSQYEALLAAGVKFITRPIPVSIGEDLLNSILYCSFFDPDGVILELYGKAQG
ncbi:MAG: VOC family protein [Cypionkella sp.]